MKRILSAAFVLLFLAGCSRTKDTSIRISVNPWVGYAPLMYIREKGWMRDSPIRFYLVVSLGESVKLYRSGLVQGFAATQYEAKVAGDASLKPVLLIDRSSGGDKVLSNRSLSELRSSPEKIDTYLEIESVNSLLLDDFVKSSRLRREDLRIFNEDQTAIIGLRPEANRPMLIVSYDPYTSVLMQRGFQEVASTKSLDLLVLDAIWVKESSIRDNEAEFRRLHGLIGRALADLRSDPEGFYRTVRPYLEGQSYSDFRKSLQELEWLHGNLSPDMISTLKQHHIPLERVIY